MRAGQHLEHQATAAHGGRQRLGQLAHFGPTLQRLAAQHVDLVLGCLDAAAQFIVLGAEAVDLVVRHCAKICREWEVRC